MYGAGHHRLREGQQRCGAKMTIAAFAATCMAGERAVSVVLVRLVGRMQVMLSGMLSRLIQMNEYCPLWRLRLAQWQAGRCNSLQRQPEDQE